MLSMLPTDAELVVPCKQGHVQLSQKKSIGDTLHAPVAYCAAALYLLVRSQPTIWEPKEIC